MSWTSHSWCPRGSSWFGKPFQRYCSQARIRNLYGQCMFWFSSTFPLKFPQVFFFSISSGLVALRRRSNRRRSFSNSSGSSISCGGRSSGSFNSRSSNSVQILAFWSVDHFPYHFRKVPNWHTQSFLSSTLLETSIPLTCFNLVQHSPKHSLTGSPERP